MDKQLNIGTLKIDTPVILAPMAGVTNSPFRRLCREFGGGLFISEMVSARALCEKNEKTKKITGFAEDETPRSLQLSVVDPQIAYNAISELVANNQVDHIDLNFGCPVKKVTRYGGGGVLPYKTKLFKNILTQAVKAANGLPITIKMRTGIDDEHLTYLEAGKIAEDTGISAITLHGRHVAQLYSHEADWDSIRQLKEEITSIPVLGNGDIWQASDALNMIKTTNCDGVVIGRGCLGRPWLFAQLEAAFNNEPIPEPPRLNEVKKIMLKHAQLLVDWFEEYKGIREFRKHTAWYLKGYPVGGKIRKSLGLVQSLEQIQEILIQIPDADLPKENWRSPRGHTGGPQKVVMPPNWLDPQSEPESLNLLADCAASGG